MRTIWHALKPLAVGVKRTAMRQRPRGLKYLGENSVVHLPVTLWGRQQISIGSRTEVMSGGLLHAVSTYAGTKYYPQIEIGDDVYIGRHVYLTAAKGITISNGCVLSEDVYITDLSHGFDPNRGLIMKQQLESKGNVVIGANCFLGYRTAIMPGVVLGEWCIVGANSVVTRSFPAYSMIAGAPARLAKVYSKELNRWVSANRSTTIEQEQS